MFKRTVDAVQKDWQLFLQNVWLDRQLFYRPGEAGWQRQSIGFHWGVLLIGVIAFFWSPMPQDDLLRHIHAMAYDYDYRQMFDGYPYPFDAWYLFDVFAGHLYQWLGVAGIKLIQTLSVMVFAWGVGLNLQRVHPDWRLWVVLLAVWWVGERFLTGRPTMFETGLLFLAIGLAESGLQQKHPKLEIGLHLALGCLMASFYHLFFIYLLPLLLWRKIYFVPLILGGIGWTFFTDGRYLQEVWEIFHFGSMRIAGVQVSENRGGLFLTLLLALSVVLFVWDKRQWRYYVTFAWFSLPMQVRYVADNLVPLTLILWAKQLNIRPHPFWILIGFVMVKSAIGTGDFWLFEPKLYYAEEKRLVTPEHYFEQGDYVLAEYLGLNFWAVHQGAAEHIRVAPAMEIGFAAPDIQKIGVTHQLSCKLLYQHQFTKVVEKTLVSLLLPCLSLDYATPEGIKIWRVLPPPR